MPTTRQPPHGYWSSPLVYLLALIGASVGFSNIWRFGYLLDQYGGLAFLVVYIVCLALIGLPLLVAEFLVGVRGRRSPLHSLEIMAAEEGRTRWWMAPGWLGLAAAVCLLAGYGVIGGWAIAYVFRSAAGVFQGASELEAAEVFLTLTRDPERLLAWHTVFMAVALMIVARGVRFGLEEAVRWFMPMLAGLMVLLLGYALTIGDVAEASSRLWRFGWSDLGWDGLRAAASQAFLTLGLGIGVVACLSAYVNGPMRPWRWMAIVAGSDLLAGLIAAMTIWPIVLGQDMDVVSGTQLVFERLPVAFAALPSGVWFGTLFFLLLVFAAWTSTIALLEPMVAYTIERFSVERSLAVSYIGIGIWAVGVVVILSFNLWEHMRPLRWLGDLGDRNVFQSLSFLAAGVFMPLAAGLYALFAGWGVSVMTSRLELGDGLRFRVWLWLIRVPVPVMMLALLLYGLGLF